MGRQIRQVNTNLTGPITRTFGTGQVRFFTNASTTFAVPAGVTSIRARVWGAGSNAGDDGSSIYGGGGGGFAMRVVTGLTPGTNITVTVGVTSGGTSSFGSHVSATGGGLPSGGSGSNGDVNYTGGSSFVSGPHGGGGAASLFGNGGDAVRADINTFAKRGASGGGGRSESNHGMPGAAGLFGNGGAGGSVVQSQLDCLAQNGTSLFSASLDLIGTGGGGGGAYSTNAGHGANGGGGGATTGPSASCGGHGGFPGGGGGYSGTSTSQTKVGNGACGLVILEW